MNFLVSNLDSVKSLPEGSIRTPKDKEILIRVNLIVTMRKSMDTNSCDFDLRGGVCNGITICHEVEDVRWRVLTQKIFPKNTPEEC